MLIITSLMTFIFKTFG